MGDRITGIKQLHEISLTRKAANGSCTKVLQKNLAGGSAHVIHQEPGQPDPAVQEESEMDAKVIKSLAGLQARTGNTGALYVAQLEDDKVKSFFEQDATAQDAEVKAWDEGEKAKAKAAEDAEKAKSAGDPEVEKLKSRLAEVEQERVVEKAAARELQLKDIAKSEYPLVPKAFDVLKSIDGLEEAARKPTLDVLKSQQEMAKSLGTTMGATDPVEGNASTKYEARVSELAKEKSITKAQASVELASSSDPADRELIREHRAAQAG